MSTLIPIPKDKRKSLSRLDNYRAIALSSVMGKLLDKILLESCQNIFCTSDLQYGFKRSHSTNQCTFVVNEIIQYYTNNESNVFITLLDASKAFDRVEYVKLFKLLIKRNMCPIVIRFLINMYICQTIRVKWCSHITELTKTSNGVKQGGVMSPLLFTIYIDVLLCRLRDSGVGCYIGNTFCGALGYADDIILLTPTVSSLKCFLDICSTYGKEYNVIFNPDKTKLINVNNHNNLPSPNVCFMGKNISLVSTDKHLGFPIGNVNNKKIIKSAVNEFTAKVNMVKCHFKYLRPDLLYKLFKTYCMPLYGSPLWDFSSKHIELFYVAWRKAIRFLYDLPRTTHCHLLHSICNDIPIHHQLYSRSVNFIKSLNKSNNQVTRICMSLALSGSNSVVSNNITTISYYMSVNRYDVFNLNKSDFNVNIQHSDEATVICDMLYVASYMPNTSMFLQARTTF